MEFLIMAGCFLGTNEACQAGLEKYVKYHKLDVKAQEISDKVKSDLPSAYYSGTVILAAGQRKYNAMLYRNVWLQMDYSNRLDERTLIMLRYTY